MEQGGVKKRRLRIGFNSPVILGMTVLCLVILALNLVTGGIVNGLLAVYRTSWLDPMQYLRLFTHVLAHQDLAHYTSNFLLILAVGPMVEEKYGSKKLAGMIAVTAVITGLINVLFFRGIALVGASGIVFMLILLASFTNIREGTIPLTVILVAVLYIGNEIIAGLTVSYNISRISHIAGGVCGAGFGLLHHGGKMRRRNAG